MEGSLFQKRRARGIEEHAAVRMELHERRGEHVRDRTFERALHRLGLAGVRTGADDRLRPQDLLHRHRERMRRHVVLRREPALADLLHTAFLIQRHDFIGAIRVNVGRRIVERDMAIFAKANAGDAGKAFSTASAAFLAAGSNDTPTLSANFLITSSESFVPSPASNIEMAGCLQPSSRAKVDWEIPCSRRAWPMLRQISGEMFFTECLLSLDG